MGEYREFVIFITVNATSVGHLNRKNDARSIPPPMPSLLPLNIYSCMKMG